MRYGFDNAHSKATYSTPIRMGLYGLCIVTFALLLLTLVVGPKNSMTEDASSPSSPFSSLSSSWSSTSSGSIRNLHVVTSNNLVSSRNRRSQSSNNETTTTNTSNDNTVPLTLSKQSSFYKYIPDTYDFILRYNDEQQLVVLVKVNHTNPIIYSVPCPVARTPVAQCYDAKSMYYNISINIWMNDEQNNGPNSIGIKKYLYLRTDNNIHIANDPHDKFFDDTDHNITTDTIIPIENINSNNSNNNSNNSKNNDNKTSANNNLDNNSESNNNTKGSSNNMNKNNINNNTDSNTAPLKLTNRGTFFEYLPGTYDFLLRYDEEHLEVWIKANKTDPEIYIVPCPDVTETIAKCYDTNGIYNITLDIWREDEKNTDGVPKYLYTRVDGKVHIVDDPYDIFFDDKDKNIATDNVTPIDDAGSNSDSDNNDKNKTDDNSTEPLELTNRLKFYEYQPDTYDFLLRYNEDHLEMWIKSNRKDPNIYIIPCPIVHQTVTRCWDDAGTFNVTLDIWMDDKTDENGLPTFLYTRVDGKVHIVDDPNDAFFDDNDQDLSTDTSMIANANTDTTDNNSDSNNTDDTVVPPPNGVAVFGYHPSSSQSTKTLSIIFITIVAILILAASFHRVIQRRRKVSGRDGIIKYESSSTYDDDPKTLREMQ